MNRKEGWRELGQLGMNNINHMLESFFVTPGYVVIDDSSMHSCPTAGYESSFGMKGIWVIVHHAGQLSIDFTHFYDFLKNWIDIVYGINIV